MTRPEDMPQPDWYSDGYQIQSQTFNHNGPQAVPLYTEETLARAILAAEQRVREECAQIAESAAAFPGTRHADIVDDAINAASQQTAEVIAAAIRKGGEHA